MSRARISAPFSLRWKPSSARTSLPWPSRGSIDVLGPAAVAAGEPRPRVDEHDVGPLARPRPRTASSWTSRRAVTSGLSSLGMPTQTTVRPPSASRSITSPARRAYSGSHVVPCGDRVVPLDGNEPSASASPWASLPPNVTTTMSGSTPGAAGAGAPASRRSRGGRGPTTPCSRRWSSATPGVVEQLLRGTARTCRRRCRRRRGRAPGDSADGGVGAGERRRGRGGGGDGGRRRRRVGRRASVGRRRRAERCRRSTRSLRPPTRRRRRAGPTVPHTAPTTSSTIAHGDADAASDVAPAAGRVDVGRAAAAIGHRAAPSYAAAPRRPGGSPVAR